MLKSQKKHRRTSSYLLLIIAVLLLGSGVYLLILVSAPITFQRITTISIENREQPKASKNQLIIPKIGVDIAYSKDGIAALDRGAWWRFPERGNPTGEGNFIIAAHRFTIQPTPLSTVEKSPFYHIDKLAVDDPIYVDYLGTRYEYRVDELKTVKPKDIEIEGPSDTGKMTLYSCGLGGERSDRLVVIALPIDEFEHND